MESTEDEVIKRNMVIFVNIVIEFACYRMNMNLRVFHVDIT